MTDDTIRLSIKVFDGKATIVTRDPLKWGHIYELEEHEFFVAVDGAIVAGKPADQE